MNLKGKIGIFGQRLAISYLKSKDYEFLAENFRSNEGEIDIIAQKDGQICFIEVKTRLSRKYGLPEESVSEKKEEKMKQTAFKYLEKQQINHDDYRFDLIAIEIDKKQKKAFIRHYKNIGQ